MDHPCQVCQQPHSLSAILLEVKAILLVKFILTVLRTTYSDPEGVTRTWEHGERLTRPKGCDIDGVGVAAILQDPAKPDDEPRIVLQKQWRPPANATVIEVPAGLMDPGESPETCAIRELKEETGYIGELVKDQTFRVTPIMFNGKQKQNGFPIPLAFFMNVLQSHEWLAS